MQQTRKINLTREFATALAVMAMLLQVIFAPILLEHHAYSVETDYGLSVLCSGDHQLDTASVGDPAAPAHDHQSHDCPCCVGLGGHATLPEPATVVAVMRVLYSGAVGTRLEAQVAEIATISKQQLPRAPPYLG
jgi:hypothetical protein